MGAFFVKWPSRHFFFFFFGQMLSPNLKKVTHSNKNNSVFKLLHDCQYILQLSREISRILNKKNNYLTRRKRRVNINRVVFNSLYLWFLPLKNELKIFILNCKHRGEFRNLGVKQCEFQSLLTSIVLVLLKGSSNQQVVLPGASNQPTRSQFSAEVHFSSDGSYPLVRQSK